MSETYGMISCPEWQTFVWEGDMYHFHKWDLVLKQWNRKRNAWVVCSQDSHLYLMLVPPKPYETPYY